MKLLLTSVVFYFGSFLFFFVSLMVTPVHANEIEIFLKHGMEITGTEQAHKAGHSISYFYLDNTQRIEQQLSVAFTLALKQELSKADKSKDTTQQIVDQFNDKTHPETANKLRTLITEDIKIELGKAWRNVNYAQGLKIKAEDLPVIRFEGVNHAKTSNLAILFEEEN